MNKRSVLWGVVILAGLILIVRLGPAKQSLAPVAELVTPQSKHAVKYVHHLKRSVVEAAPAIVPSSLPPAETNAANIYRDAISLFDALTQSNKDILSNWQTNLAATIVAELCEKIRPICADLYQASLVTNCDWGLGPLAPGTKLPHLRPARDLGRVAIWSAAHCRPNDGAAATEDVLATLRLGQQIATGAAILGYLVDMKLQEMAWSYVAANLDTFSIADGQQLAAAFDALAYDDAFGRAMAQESDFVDRFAAKLAALPPTAVAKQLGELGSGWDQLDPATVVNSLNRLANLQRDLTKMMATGTAADYTAWLQRAEQLQAAIPFVKDFLPSAMLLEKWQGYEVNRALVEAGLAVAANGAAGLATHLDPASGGSFTYRAVPGGFELQSTYQVNHQPLKIYFRQRVTRKESS